MQQPNTSGVPAPIVSSLDALSTQELEALGDQLNADMRANSAAWTQFQPSKDHRSLELIQQWQADVKQSREDE